MAGERELAEIVLTEVLPIWRVREALIGRLPHGWRLVDLYDVWLGLPALAARATGAVYRVVVQGDLDADRVAEVAAAAMAAEHLPRLRVKSGVEVEYDLRPLLAEVGVLLPGPPIVLGIRTRISPDLGHGRPEEVLATIADHLGVQLTAGSITRERLLLVDD